MSFDKIQAVIIAEAETEAKRIVDAARQESETLVSKAREENDRAFEEAVRQAEAATVRETSRQVGQARHEGRLQVLEAKNRVIDDVFRKASGEIQSLPDKEYMNLMAEWLKALPAEVGGTLLVGTRDAKRYDQVFLESVNKTRPESGKLTSVKTDPQIESGFVVAGETYTVNATIENKIHELRESLAGDLAKELFGS